jgi:hypothetical protein
MDNKMSEHKDFIDMLNRNDLRFSFTDDKSYLTLIFNVVNGGEEEDDDDYDSKIRKVKNDDLIPMIVDYFTKNNINFELVDKFAKKEIVGIKEEYKDKAEKINMINETLKIFTKDELKDIFPYNHHNRSYGMTILNEWYEYKITYLPSDNPYINVFDIDSDFYKLAKKYGFNPNWE